MRSQRGFSLLEVLIASTILATALLALANISVRGMASAAQSLELQQAASLAREAQAIANLTAIPPAGLTQPLPVATRQCRNAACSSAELFSSEWVRWQAGVSERLPEGQGIICRDGSPQDGDANAPACDGNGALVIKIFWRPMGGLLRKPQRHVQGPLL